MAGPLLIDDERPLPPTLRSPCASVRNTWIPLKIRGSRTTNSLKTSPAVWFCPVASYQNGSSSWLVPLLERS